MKLKHALAAVAATAFAVTPAAAQLAEGVAAVVNDDVISTYDVRQRANLLLASAGVQATPELMTRARNQALRALEDEHLQLQEAEEYDVEITEAEIDSRLASIARGNNASAEELAQQLAASGVGIATLRHQIKADIAWQRLMGGLYGNRVRISDLEVQETQARMAAEATQPRYLVSEVFLPAENPQQFAELEQGAQRLLEEMLRGAPFPLVARQFSASPSAAAGGDIGWVPLSALPSEVAAVIAQLNPGEVSRQPIRTEDGIYLVALRDRRVGVDQAATSRVTLRQVSAPIGRLASLERMQRRLESCSGLDTAVSAIQDATVVDLGEAAESDLSPAIRARIEGVQAGRASAVEQAGGQANIVVVCQRQAGGAGVPSREDIEGSLYDQEMAMLSDRYLRNLRREATIIRR